MLPQIHHWPSSRVGPSFSSCGYSQGNGGSGGIGYGNLTLPLNTTAETTSIFTSFDSQPLLPGPSPHYRNVFRLCRCNRYGSCFSTICIQLQITTNSRSRHQDLYFSRFCDSILLLLLHQGTLHQSPNPYWYLSVIISHHAVYSRNSHYVRRRSYCNSSITAFTSEAGSTVTSPSETLSGNVK